MKKGISHSIRYSLILLTIAIFLFVIKPTSANGVLIDSYKIWTFYDLGYSNINMSGHDVANQYSILYSLPKGAEQGKEGWYICHLDFEVEFDDSTSPGLFYLIAFTNGYACAQIKFQVKKDNNGINVNWSTVDLVNGGIHRSQKTSIVHGTFNNYVQLAGVRPGENNLTLQTRRLGDVKVNNIFIDGKKSGIEYTEASPPLLNLEMELPNTYGLTVGDRFTLGFTLENLSEVPASNVSISSRYPDDALQLTQTTFPRTASFEGLKKGQLEFEALKDGTHEVIVYVNSASGVRLPYSKISVIVGNDNNSPTLISIPLMAGTLLIILLLAYGATQHLSKLTRTHHDSH